METGVLVSADQDLTLPCRSSNGNNLRGEGSGRSCLGGRELTFDGEGILIFTSELLSRCDVFSGDAHSVAMEGISEAVFQNRVDKFAIAVAISEASPDKQVERSGHKLRATG